MRNLLFKMGKIVEENMKIYQSDFYNYDKTELLNASEGQSYLWYVRDSGTHIYKYDIVHFKNHQDRVYLEYWLSASRVFKIDVVKVDSNRVYGEIEELSHSTMKELLSNARLMTVEEKLMEVKEWAIFEGNNATCQDRALYAFNYYKLNEVPTLNSLGNLLTISTTNISKEDLLNVLDELIKKERVA